MPEIESGGTTAFYGTGGGAWTGERDPVVMLHGAGMDHSVWAIQARDLALHDSDVVAPDLPGHGRSADRDDIESIADHADWLESLLRVAAPDAERLSVVGHSMGACIALTWAARHPDRIARLALVGAGHAMPVNDQLLDDCLNQPQRAAQFIAAFGHSRNSHFGGSATPGLWMLGTSVALLERCQADVLHRDFVACNEWSAKPYLDDVTADTLVVSGEEDRMTPAAAGRKLAEQLGADYALIEGAGHMMMAEAPDRLSALLRGHLRPG